MIAKHHGNCKPHQFQDETYGQGFRVMNPVRDDKGHITGARCTVCAPAKEPGRKRGGIYVLADLKIKSS